MAIQSFTLVQNLEHKRRWILALGVLQVILGSLAVAFVGVTSLMSVIYLGAILMIAGVSEVVYGFRHREHGDLWFHLLFGVVTSVCGFFVWSNPVANMVVLTILLAAFFIATGLVTLLGSLIERFHNWGWFAINGVISVAAGYLILTNPLESSIWLIGLLVGFQLISRGIAWVTLAWSAQTVTTAIAT